MRFQCRIGDGPPPLPQPGTACLPVSTAPSKPKRSRRWQPKLLHASLAGVALVAAAGCASIDGKRAKSWRVEPVLNVSHSLQSADAYYTIGRHHDAAGEWTKSIDAYRKAIAVDASHIEAYNGLGVALAQSGRHADAETTLRQAVALDPQRAHVRSNLGYVLLLAGKPREAVAELKAAVKQDANSAAALANLREAVAHREVVHARQAAADEVGVEVGSVLSVPAPITSVDVPVPLAGAVTVPMPVGSTSAPSPRALQVVDQPTVAAMDMRQPNAGAVRAAPPPAVAVAALQALPTSVDEPLSRLEVSNGNGAKGMAARVGRWLGSQGIQTVRLTNQRPFAQPTTIVQYRSGHEASAERVVRSLPAYATTAPAPTQGLRSDVRVVLGHDWVRAAACLQRDTCKPEATSVAAAPSQ